MEKWNIINLWIDDHNKPIIEPHSHNWHELIYFNKGRVLTHIDDKAYEVGEGTFVIIPKKTRHDEVRYGDTQTVCLIFTSEDEVEAQIYTDDSGKVLAQLMAMNKEARTKPYKFRDVLQFKLQELYVLIERIKLSEKSVSKDFRYAINHINDNYKSKVDFHSLAQRLNMSYSYFRHSFKQITGLPPQAFLIKRRLDAAEKLLIKGDLNCTEIAYYCGFSNSAQFTDMFKREYGMPPKDYRKRFK